MAHTYKTLREKNGIHLLRRDDGKFAVVGYSEQNHQYYSVMPGDNPQSGHWFGSNSFEGIDYVSNGYSESYAHRMFNQLSQN